MCVLYNTRIPLYNLKVDSYKIEGSHSISREGAVHPILKRLAIIGVESLFIEFPKIGTPEFEGRR